jgi:hypothetical protein
MKVFVSPEPGTARWDICDSLHMSLPAIGNSAPPLVTVLTTLNPQAAKFSASEKVFSLPRE